MIGHIGPSGPCVLGRAVEVFQCAREDVDSGTINRPITGVSRNFDWGEGGKTGTFCDVFILLH